MDILPLWWFTSTDFFLLTNFGHGNLYGWQDDPALWGYIFEGASRVCQIYFKTDQVHPNSLTTHIYLEGWGIASIDERGKVKIMDK